MVVGNGLIASAFTSFVEDDEFLILASGVSNSSTKDQSQFERESSLISGHSGSTARVVYFSTCSIHDPSLTDSPYIVHKRAMESLVAKTFNNHLILRLPNVIGPSGNPNTLFHFLVDRIRLGESFELHANASRYLLDVEEVERICTRIIRTDLLDESVYDVVIPPPFRIKELISVLEEEIGKKAQYTLVEKGHHYEVDHGGIKQFVPAGILDQEPSQRLHNIVRRSLTILPNA